jgi:hypothetical protein
MAIGTIVATGKTPDFLISLNYFNTIKKIGGLRARCASWRVPVGFPDRWGSNEDGRTVFICK